MVEVSYDIPEGLPDSTSLYVAAQGVANIPYPQARDLALQSIFRLVDSVLAAPEDAKKRRVRKGNPTFHAKVGQHKVALDFLRCAGFMDADDPETPGKAGKGSLLVMQVAYIVRLTDAHHALADASQRCGCAAPAIPAGNFNPYQENRLAGGAVKQQEWRGEAEQLRDEVKKREQELKDKLNFAAPVDLQPKVFWLSSGRRLEDVVKETATLPEEDLAEDAALLQSTLGSLPGHTTGLQGFQNADKTRLVELSRIEVHERCVLRVICPDKSVLQAHFLAGEQIERVVERLGPLFSKSVQDSRWYLYQSPPLRRFQLKETLSAAGLTPGANVYLGFSGERPSSPYLADRLVLQLGPLPSEDQRGVSISQQPAVTSGDAQLIGSGQNPPAGNSSAAGTLMPPSALRSTTTKDTQECRDASHSSAMKTPTWFKAGAAPVSGAGVRTEEPEFEVTSVKPGGFFSCIPAWCHHGS